VERLAGVDIQRIIDALRNSQIFAGIVPHGDIHRRGASHSVDADGADGQHN
jgi:hypothetical protein